MTLIRNAWTVIDGQILQASVLIDGEIISDICPVGQAGNLEPESRSTNADTIIDADGMWLMPGVIDDHVHFRDPGLTHKADMATESRAAAAGGVTTVFDMPNCKPQTVTVNALQDKFSHAAETCIVNHSFYLGATHDNLDQIEKIDPKRVCGVKLFMGSSTGGMLVDDDISIRNVFKSSPVPVAAHCEDSSIINANMVFYTEKCHGEPPVIYHPLIRSAEACYASTSKAVEIATATDARLHVMHISTERELGLFKAGALNDKKITAECCPAHLWFTDRDYDRLGTLIKCNPAVKTESDRSALRKALTCGVIDVIGTDHAPHLPSEKQGGCKSAASGMPVLPFSLPLMLELTEQGILSITDVVRLMCNNPATLFDIDRRGFIRKGYKADLVLVSHISEGWTADANDSPSKCGWTPFHGQTLHWKVNTTWVNGHPVYSNGMFDSNICGQAVTFKR